MATFERAMKNAIVSAGVQAARRGIRDDLVMQAVAVHISDERTGGAFRRAYVKSVHANLSLMLLRGGQTLNGSTPRLDGLHRRMDMALAGGKPKEVERIVARIDQALKRRS